MEVNNLEFWNIAYRDNASALLGVLRRYVKEVSIAQDLLHEAFITAIDKHGSYTGRGSFEGWLHRIAVNTALMYLRREQNKQVATDTETWHVVSLSVMDDDETDNEQTDNAKTIIETAEFSNEELLAAIDRLPEHHKMVFNMYVMDDFSHKQIAAELNISPGTSKSHLARARKKIQQFLYNDAVNKKKITDRRWTSALVLLFPIKRHYIDGLYRNALSDFTLTPAGGSEFLSVAVAKTQHTTSLSATTAQTAAFWGSKLSYVAVGCGAAAITGTVCWLLMNGNNPSNGNHDLIINVIEVSDTLTYSLPNPIKDDTITFEAAGNFISSKSVTTKMSPKTETPPKVEEPFFQDDVEEIELIYSAADSSAETTAEPVIIKKQIIQHQTVIVRDTIIISE